MHQDAYAGLTGAIVSVIAPHTEADPVAILGQLLVAAGSIIGRGAFFEVEATRHHPNEFVVLVGDSAKARKGSSWDHVARLLARAEPDLALRTQSGLSTGEGLVWAVRDPAGVDPGAPDFRLLVVEPEFASVLKATGRDVNTLSPVLRSAWDGRPLQLLTRNAPARASAAHVAVIGHITATELRAQLHAVELANGFLNRFVLLACRRVRLLPEGGDPDPLASTGLGDRLAATLETARRAGPVRFSIEARACWWDTYARLSEAGGGLAGAMCARGEAHVVRLALIYALIDGCSTIGLAHLNAALALWDYATRSAAWALESASGDPLAEQIHAALSASPGGLTRTQIRDLFHRNQSAPAIDRALAALAYASRARRQQVRTAGRPADNWTAVDAEAH
ncbi:MAG: DUF3987 domain-containing protein [Steroidobacteraceae bacterium]